MNRRNLIRRAKEILGPLDKYYRQCHGASLELVRSGLGDRVARGACRGVGSQHSWVVIGDPYAPAIIIDPTLWSYRMDVSGVFVGNPDIYGHTPLGAGNIWAWGKPIAGDGLPVKLTPKTPLSPEAKTFLQMLEPLDIAGWQNLSNAPVGGWPASEIFRAMYETPAIKHYVPIDKIGMLTDINPGGLYF